MDTKGKVALGILGGLLVGSAIGLLMAPNAGKKTRDFLLDKAAQLRLQCKCCQNEVNDPTDNHAERLG